MASTVTATQQMSADEQMARQMQEEENALQQQQGFQQHPGFQQQGFGGAQMGMPPGAQMGFPPGSQVPVVQGMAVGGGMGGMAQPYGIHPGMQPGMQGGMYPGMQGGPVMYGAPAGGPVALGYGMGVDPVTGVVDSQIVDEMTVLRYRCSLTCFAVIDAFSSVLDAASRIHAVSALLKGEEVDHTGRADQGGDEKEYNTGNPWLFALLGLLFLVGPICGLLGARRLQRGLISVYLAFCLIKASYYIFMAVMTLHIWLILIALVQMWVARIVFSFWRALGKLSPDRIQALLDPASPVNNHPGGMRPAYW